MTVLELLESLVATPSLSGEEAAVARRLWGALAGRGLPAEVVQERNVLVRLRGRSPGPTLLFNSHLDTVPPVSGWTRDPFRPTREDGRLYGLGANDAKGCVAAMAGAVAAVAAAGGPLRGTLLFAATCSEEAGPSGLEALLPSLGPIDDAVVGEPTGLQICVAQNGLLILELTAAGRAGHAARPQLADNALYHAARDVLALEALAGRLDRDHPAGDGTSLAVTVLQGGDRHNVIPGECRIVVDLRTTSAHTPEYLVARVRGEVRSLVRVRSDRLRARATPPGAPVLAAARAALPDAPLVSSPTLSDWAHLEGVAAVKLGPGLSEVSHTADEWVEIGAVEKAAEVYRRIAAELLGSPK